ncbi:cupredoxin domain-containing protein [Deinococcus yavapaiensis]|uniref:Plastocyanin n=1 Tax=Deinococcus yavapaiensis KR-236 TaxID=694435 RepID=A0A318S1C9_9DEIO|nr:plastocyanin/azurin family copper-binding protein [Deinococcus yavapaiensis]PYE49953.1 plastocyanin [Deinococcus yavapaiensis KR-236]
MTVRFGVFLFLLTGLSLVSGEDVTSIVVPFEHGSHASDAPRGEVRVEHADAATRVTTLSLAGLTPREEYVAHYHALPAGFVDEPCASNGPVTVTFAPFTAGEDGRATVEKRVPEATVQGNAGAYVDIHPARDASVTSLCAVLFRAAPHDHGGAVAATTVEVAIGDNFFRPSSLTVPIGTTVTWRYEGATAHDVVALDGSFQSAELRNGDTFRHTFDRAGTVTYYCSYHEGMTATITVVGRP